MSMLPRRSKFRHVFAEAPRTEDNWTGIRLTSESWDSNYCAVNPKYIAIPWNVGGGGAVGILDVKTPGKLQDVPLCTGHRGSVLDVDWNPFNDNVLATASNDSSVKIWVIPESGPSSTDECAQDLRGHNRKVGTVRWNPVADNILASSAADFNVNVYDVRSGDTKCSVGGHSNLVGACEWNYNGSIIATACKDKIFRIIDPRAGQIVSQHDRTNVQGTKGTRLIWAGKRDFVVSVGFGKNNQRQYEIYDARNLDAPIVPPVKLDSASGVLMPFYDMDTELLFLAGKGDGNIRYYELDFDSGTPTVNYITDFTSNVPIAGCGYMPKRGVNVSVNEIVRLFKVTPEIVQSLSFRVLRKSEAFADDIFVPCSSDEPALSADQWLGGDNSEPRTVSLEGAHVARERAPTTFTKTETTEVEPSGAALLNAYREQKQRIAYLESELNRLKNR